MLIVTGQNGHNWRGTTPILRKILEDTGKFEVRVTEEFRGAGPETLAPYDLVVLNYFERGRPELRWGEKPNAAFLDFVRSGKGVVVYHFSMAAFDGWTEYEKMSGGNWRPNNGHHSAPHNFTVDIKDQEHPITKGLKLSFPQANDELYANLRWQPPGSYHVLATANDDHALYAASRTDSRAPQPLEGASANEPMLWTRGLRQGPGVRHRAGARRRAGADGGVQDDLRARRRVGRHRQGDAADSGRDGERTAVSRAGDASPHS